MGNSTHKQEQRILRALLRNLGAAGFKPAAVYIDDAYVMVSGDKVGEVNYRGRGDLDTIERPMLEREVLQVFEDYDLCTPTVHFTHQGLTTWGNRGVQVAPGNGCDFICDWHCGAPEATGDIKAFDAIVTEVADAAGEEAYA